MFMKTYVELPGKRIAPYRTLTILLSILMAGLAFRAAGADPAGEPYSAENSVPLIKVDKAISATPGVRVRNIEVFALVGPDQITKRDYLTLSEAMDKHLVRVDETRNVSQLRIERLSCSAQRLIARRLARYAERAAFFGLIEQRAGVEGKCSQGSAGYFA